MKNTNDFSKCKVGQELWSIEVGDCKFEKITNEGIFVSNNDNVIFQYNFNGTYLNWAKNQSLYFSNPNIIAPEKPKEKIPFDLEKALSGEYDLVTLNDIIINEWHYFKNVNKGYHFCIICGIHDKVQHYYINGKVCNKEDIIHDYDLFLIKK